MSVNFQLCVTSLAHGCLLLTFPTVLEARLEQADLLKKVSDQGEGTLLHGVLTSVGRRCHQGSGPGL